MRFLGSVNADNVNDPESLESVRLGFMCGSGLLGKVLDAGMEMGHCENEHAFGQCDKTARELEASYIAFYKALKAIEEWWDNK